MKYFLYIIFINLVYYSIRTKDNNPKTNNHNMVCVREDENNGYMARLCYLYRTVNNEDKKLCRIFGRVFAFMLVLVLVLILTLVLTNIYIALDNSIHKEGTIIKCIIDISNVGTFNKKEFDKIIRDQVEREMKLFIPGYGVTCWSRHSSNTCTKNHQKLILILDNFISFK